MAAANTTHLGGVSAGDLTATGSTLWYNPEKGGFNVSVRGTWVGSWALERSFDGGTTAIPYSLLDTAFAPTTNLSSEFEQVEKNALWRLTWTRTSGTLTYRLSQ